MEKNDLEKAREELDKQCLTIRNITRSHTSPHWSLIVSYQSTIKTYQRAAEAEIERLRKDNNNLSKTLLKYIEKANQLALIQKDREFWKEKYWKLKTQGHDC